MSDPNYLVVQQPDDSVDIAIHPVHQHSLGLYNSLERELQQRNEWLAQTNPINVFNLISEYYLLEGEQMDNPDYDRIVNSLENVLPNDNSGRTLLQRVQDFELDMSRVINRSVDIERAMDNLRLDYGNPILNSVEVRPRRNDIPQERLNLFRARHSNSIWSRGAQRRRHRVDPTPDLTAQYL